jgi:hypothetical protein
MKNRFLYLMVVVWAGAAVAQCLAPTQPSSQPVRTTGIITQLQPGNSTPHSEAAPDLLVLLLDRVSVLRVPPRAKDLNVASKVTASEIGADDRADVQACLRQPRNPSSLRLASS